MFLKTIRDFLLIIFKKQSMDKMDKFLEHQNIIYKIYHLSNLKKKRAKKPLCSLNDTICYYFRYLVQSYKEG